MKKKVKTALIISGVILAILIVATMVYFLYPSGQSVATPSSSFNLPSSEKLDFCSSLTECYNALSLKGITTSMLSEKGIKIECTIGQCYAQKI